jgi:hypothetical protein
MFSEILAAFARDIGAGPDKLRNVSMTLRRPEPEIKLVRVAYCEAG